MESIIQKNKNCLLCGTSLDIHKHHIFYGSANRILSEKYGLTCYLCAKHHNFSDSSVHFNKEFDKRLKIVAQNEFEKEHTRDEFIKIFGRSWL